MNKILILHTSATLGGAEYSLLEFLYHLKELPVEVHLALSPQTKKLFKDKVNIPVYFHPFELYYFKKHQSLKFHLQSLISLIRCSYEIFRLVKKQNIKAVYCNTFRTLPYCLIIKLFGKTQVICHCRDNIPSKWIQHLIHYGSNQSIAVSAFRKKQFSSDDKVKIIPNGVNISGFSGSKPTGWLHKELNLSRDIQLIGNIGQIVNWKNQTDCVLIAKELIVQNTHLHFLLVGASVDDDYFRLVKQQIASFHLCSYFTLTGQVEDIKKYIGELDILIHTAINEPFGRVIIEAAAASKPVVAYNSGGPAEIIKNGETGFLVPERNIPEMVECVFLLLNNRSLRKSIGSSARKHIAGNFNSIDYARKVYNTLTDDSYFI
jgi:glycosyltransferase involved in cell wall biosynthesis